MTSKEILFLPSSSPKPFTTYNMSSSPQLPSPSDIFSKKAPILRTGSRAASIPHNATASFTSASSLLKLGSVQDVDTIRSFRLGLRDYGSPGAKTSRSYAKARSRSDGAGRDSPKNEKPMEKPRTAESKEDAAVDELEAKKPRKPRKSKVHQPNNGATEKKAPRKSKPRKVDSKDAPTQEKTSRKPRTKRIEGVNQTRFPSAQVTKASISTDKLLIISKNQHITETSPFTDSLNHGLIQAVKRRFSWTPPPPDAQTPLLSTPVPADSLLRELASGRFGSEEKDKSFRDLLGNFGFSKVEGNTTETIVSEGGGTRKRKLKLIELVKTNIPALSTGPKAKAPRKRAKTITEQATSAYAEAEEEAAKPASLLQYFPLETTGSVANDGFKVPPRPRSKSPVKGGKGTAQAPILLSPASALKQVGNQSFVFGTSSQLAREESPGFLRDIHAAMQASNEADNDDAFASSSICSGTKPQSLSTMKRDLWSAAARDTDGRLLDVEIVDLADSPAMARELHSSALAEVGLRKEDDQPWHDIEELVEAPIEEKVIENSPKRVGAVEAAIRLELLSSPSGSLKSRVSTAKSSTLSKVVSPKPPKAQANKATKLSQAKDVEKPNFAAYTMAQLMKEIASYRFKPVKGRDKMIALLEQCWDAKHRRRALESLPTNLPVSSPNEITKAVSKVPPSSQLQSNLSKRPRGRPRKDGSATPSPKRKTKTASLANALSRARKAQKKADALDEISDSDTAQTPSPPRRHPSQVGTPPSPLQLSSLVGIDSRELSPTSSQARLFKYITAAVRNASLATDLPNPSWHEKILLYDPIILEDLTVWLNTGALEKAGWDGEVDPKEVKKWCESQSICCLWKENLRGGSRSRY